MKGRLMRRKQEYSKELVAKALNKTGYLSRRKIDKHSDLPSYSTVLRLFKTTSINNVWKELNIISQKPSYTKKEVVTTLKGTGYLTQKEIDQHPDLPSVLTIVKLFKTTSINDVWKDLNIPFTQKPSYTKEEVSKALKKTGYLTSKEINQHPDLPAHTTVLRLFKTTSMANIWKELGIPFTQKPSYTKESVSKALKEIGWLENKDINQHPDLPSYTTILRLFKATSIDNVWEELDIDIFGI